MAPVFESVDRVMRSGLDQQVFPGAVLLVAVRGEVVFRQAYGWADLFSRRPMTCDTFFDLASLTKPLATALTVMHLVQKGLLALDRPCRSDWPGFFKADKASITVRHLLGHCSGFPAWRPWYLHLHDIPDRAVRRQKIEAWTAVEPLVSAPGTRSCYSDVGYWLLQWLVEGVVGQALDRYVTEHLYGPLSIGDLFFNPAQRPKREYPYAATELCPWRGRLLIGRVHDDNAYALGGVGGHAGLFGTADAVWKVLQKLLDTDSGALAGGVFDRVVLRSFLQRQFGSLWTLGFDTPDPVGSSAGRYFGPESVGHLGFTGTSFWMERRQGIIVVLLTNRVHPTRYNPGIKAFRPLLHDAVMQAAVLV